MPYMDNVQGRGSILNTHITLHALDGTEGTDAVIVTVKRLWKHKLHLKMQFKEAIYIGQ